MGSAQEQLSDPPLIQIGGGVFNSTGHNRRVLAQIEYKWKPVVAKLRPLAGLMGTDKMTFYGYGGIGYDLFLGRYIVLTPSFSPGLYYPGKGKDLGSPIEFRSSIEAAVVFQRQFRLGTQLYHLSNAGLGKKNPGIEALLMFLAIAL